jgi:hypothetical protein
VRIHAGRKLEEASMKSNVLCAWVFLMALVSVTVVGQRAADDARFDGKPTFKSGDGYGYYVWREGETWKVRWTTFGQEHRFQGNVRTDGGAFADMKRIDVDTERKVIRPGYAPRVWVGPHGRTHVGGGQAPVVAERKEDRIERDDARTIRFDARTGDDIDGFDFKLEPGVERLRFTLMIDGRARALDVTIGGGNQHPVAMPFVVSLR